MFCFHNLFFYVLNKRNSLCSSDVVCGTKANRGGSNRQHEAEAFIGLVTGRSRQVLMAFCLRLFLLGLTFPPLESVGSSETVRYPGTASGAHSENPWTRENVIDKCWEGDGLALFFKSLPSEWIFVCFQGWVSYGSIDGPQWSISQETLWRQVDQ